MFLLERSSVEAYKIYILRWKAEEGQEACIRT
jgi:hypothetical protein